MVQFSVCQNEVCRQDLSDGISCETVGILAVAQDTSALLYRYHVAALIC